jgi:hypothetical protein
MHFGYSYVRGKVPTIAKQLTVAIGLVALPVALRLEKVHASPEPIPNKQPPPASADPKHALQNVPAPAPDPRTIRLQKFFAKLHCPVQYLAEDFVRAADDNQLDWRLLPSISVIESGGGKAYRNNNIFGWANGLEPFPSIRAAINHVAFKLGKSPLYQNRDIPSKLRIYNPEVEDYPTEVMTVMNRISPVANLKSPTRIVRHRNEFVYASD